MVTNQYSDRSFITIQYNEIIPYNIIIPFLKGSCSNLINELKMILICLSLSVFLQGLILHQLQRYSLAEKILRDAVQVNSTPMTCGTVWEKCCKRRERRRRDRMLPYCPGAGGQLSHLTFHTFPSFPAPSETLRALTTNITSVRESCMNHST